MELGAELRLGQVVRAYRKDLHLDEPQTLHGCIDFPSCGKKASATVVLTKEERVAVDDAMHHGYLMELESAYTAGAVKNYPLFPARRLVGGYARLGEDAKRKPLDRSGLLKMFHALEEVAGVASVPGRGWYGIRRLTSDLAADITQDTRILDGLGGWTDSSTREMVYQRRISLRLSGQIATVRQGIRDRLPKPDMAPTAAPAGPQGPPTP